MDQLGDSAQIMRRAAKGMLSEGPMLFESGSTSANFLQVHRD